MTLECALSSTDCTLRLLEMGFWSLERLGAACECKELPSAVVDARAVGSLSLVDARAVGPLIW